MVTKQSYSPYVFSHSYNLFRFAIVLPLSFPLLVQNMKNWQKWIDKDVIVTMKDGKQLSGVLKGPVIPSKNTIPDEFRLLNGVFVTRIKTKDISTIQDAF